MPTCATCRFAGSPAPIYVSGEGTDWELLESEHVRCTRIIHGNSGGVTCEALREPAVVTDGSGYAASLRVLPTFGCILHEPKAPM